MKLTNHHQPWRPSLPDCRKRQPTFSPLRSCMSSSYKGYHMFTVLLSAGLYFSFYLSRKFLFCVFHCCLVRQNIYLKTMNREAFTGCLGYRTNTKKTMSRKIKNLYVSTKLPCTRSPNSWFSASSWAKNCFSAVQKNFSSCAKDFFQLRRRIFTQTESKLLVAQISPGFGLVCFWLAFLKREHGTKIWTGTLWKLRK